MKRLISLVLCLALIVSVCAIPAQASGIGTGILITASAASVISAALIGLGVLPGTDGSVFDGIVSGAADYLSSIGFGDGVGFPLLKYVGAGGGIQYALQSAALIALRSWLFSEDVVTTGAPVSSWSTSYSYLFNGDQCTFTSSGPSGCSYYEYVWPDGVISLVVLFAGSTSRINVSGSSTLNFIELYSSYSSYKYSTVWIGSASSSDFSMPYLGRFNRSDFSSDAELYSYAASIYFNSITSPYDVSLGDVAAEDVELPVGYPNWAIDSVQVPGGGGDEDPLPYVPIGIGDSLEGTKTMTQTEVQSGQSTLVTDDDGTDVEVEGEVGGSISSGGSGGGDLPSGTETPTVDDLITMFAWLAARIDDAVATLFPDLQVIKTYLKAIATWHETENVKYDSMLSYFMGWDTDFDAMMNSLSAIDLKLSNLVADSSVIKAALATISNNVQDIRDVIADPLDADINESQQDNKQSFLSNFGNKGQSDNIGSLGGLSDGFTEWFDLPDVDISLLWGQIDDGYSGFFSSQVKQGLALGGGSSATGVGLMSDSPIEYVTPGLDAWNTEVNSIFSGGGSD